jgi:alpha-tubulin suppressor-like RCC1 family protein
MALAVVPVVSGPVAADPAASTVVAWGHRGVGALGNGTTVRRTTPVNVCAVSTTDCETTELDDVVSVATGRFHNLALLGSGMVLSWGYNIRGQLGDGTTTNRPAPVPVCAVGATDCAANPLAGVVAIAAGDYHNLALLTDGTVVAWGGNYAGQLGTSAGSADRTTPTRVCDVGSSDCAADPLAGVIAIAVGTDHSFALRAGGAVVSWGANSTGQLGDNTTSGQIRPVTVCAVGATNCTANPLVGVTAIAGGSNHSVGVLSDGSVVAWGSNQGGRLGTNGPTSQYTPAPVCAVGATDCSADPLTGIATLAVDGAASLALGTDGTVVGWGANLNGQLGDGTTTSRSVPVRVCAVDCAEPLGGIASIATSGGHSLAVSTTGATFAWGFGEYGQLGDRARVNRTSPVRVCAVKATDCAADPLAGASAVGAGDFFSVALLSDGTVRAWGDHQYGQLGDGAIEGTVRPDAVCAPDCTPLTGVTAVSANGGYVGGGGHSLALRSDGSVLSWGGNNYGQLGDGAWQSRDLPAEVCGVGCTAPLTGVTAVATGTNHSLALLSDGTVVGWGRNGVGNLGNGTWWDSATPVRVCAAGATTCTGPLTDVVAIAAGGDHSLALLSDGTVVGWGSNYNGQLGDGTGGMSVQAKNIPVRVCAVGATNCAAQPLSGVVAIKAGGSVAGTGGHSVALLSDGTVAAWGANYHGQLADGTTTNRTRPVRVCAVGATDCSANPLTNATAIGAAGAPSAAVVAGTVVAWGANNSGQLGDATTTNRTSPVRVCAVNATDCTANPLTGVTGITLGYSHSLALVAGGTVLSWGDNWAGQLGNGTTTNRATPGWVCAHGQSDCAANPLTGVTAVASGYNHNLAIVGA